MIYVIWRLKIMEYMIIDLYIGITIDVIFVIDRKI